MKLNIYCNVSTRKAEATASGQSLTWPEFTAGDRVKIGVRFTEQIEGARSERSLNLRAARLTLGVVDAPPVSGQWALKVGAGASTASNTTPLLAYNISPSALQATLEALTVTTGSLSPVSVQQFDGTFLIRFGAGAQTSLSVASNTLFPTSFARIRERERSGAYEYELRLMQAPLATAPTFARELPPQPAVEQIQDGGADASNTYLIPEIQKLSVPALFRGTFFLRYGAYQKSTMLGVDLDSETLAAALAEMFTPQGYAPEVTETDDGWLIVFNDEASNGVDIDPLTVEVFDAPEGDVTFDLDLNTREVFDALRGAALRRDVVLEMEGDIVDDDEDVNDLGAVARTVTLLHQPVTLRRELRWDGLAAAATVDWLRPPEPVDYVPFTTSQVLTGNQQAFTAVIGDGAATVFVVDHNLGSEVAHVVVRENSTPGALIEQSDYNVSFTSTNSLTLTFATPPALNSRAVAVTAIGPASVFQTHTHTLAQVNGLQDLIDDLGSRLQTLEEILPSTGPAATGNSTTGLDVLFPETREVLHYRGDNATLWDDKTGLKAASLPARAPYMLPAVHDATTAALPGTLPAPAAGTVWEAASRTLIPIGGGVRSGYVEAGGFVASDGRVIYPANRWSTSSSYYPASHERTLWSLAINDKMLALGRTFEVVFGVQAQLVGATCQAQWVLVVELGTYGADTTPGTPGLNLSGVTWGAPVFEQAFVLSPLAQSHFFGIRIKRLANSFTLDQQLYGVWGGNNAAAPASANFAIRARLTRFDTENRDDPRGWVGYQLIGEISTSESGEQETKPARARIF